jgi:hypothetical protein
MKISTDGYCIGGRWREKAYAKTTFSDSSGFGQGFAWRSRERALFLGSFSWMRNDENKSRGNEMML